MLPIAPTLAGFRGIRGDVLVAVKKSQPITASELADEFGVTANAVRRHLKELEAEGLVRCARQVRGVGGPRLGYSLTEAGEALFPRAYETTLTTLLDTVREQRGADGVVELFRAQWERVAAGAKEEMAALPLNERTQLLAEFHDAADIVDELLRADNGQRPAPSAVLDAVLDLRAAVRAGTRKVEQVLTPEQRAALEAYRHDPERPSHSNRDRQPSW